MVLRKIIKIVANRCQILRLKCTKFDFGSAPDPTEGAYSAPSDPLAGFKGPTSKGSGGEGRGGRGGERKGEGRGRKRGKGRGREGPHQLGGPRAPKHVKTALISAVSGFTARRY